MGPLRQGHVSTREECSSFIVCWVLLMMMAIPVLLLSGLARHGLLCHLDMVGFFLTAVRRCRPGVRCCSGRCGYDRGMGRKAPGP